MARSRSLSVSLTWHGDPDRTFLTYDEGRCSTQVRVLREELVLLYGWAGVILGKTEPSAVANLPIPINAHGVKRLHLSAQSKTEAFLAFFTDEATVSCYLPMAAVATLRDQALLVLLQQGMDLTAFDL